jgi:hypothetical protein
MTKGNSVSVKMSEVVEIDLMRQFRTQHHAIAQLIAFGLTDQMIMRRTGVTKRRLVLLKGDPAFQELIAGYSGQRDEDFNENIDPYRDLSYTNMMAGEMTVAEHFERAADNGELVPIAIANKISQERADRLGYSKHTVVHHEHDFAAALDRAISRSKPVLVEQVVPETPPALPAPPVAAGTPIPPDPSPPPRSPSARRREVLNRRFG